jgi:signal transduction histidine kinase
LLAVVAAVACGRPAAERLDEEGWRHAESVWKRGEPTAYQAWQTLDPERPFGRQAWTRLRDADVLYRRAVDLVRAGQPNLRETLARALALAPMDPALYLPFARACRDRGSPWRAADFYRKYLARNPDGPDAELARAELSALGGDPDFPPDFDPRADGAGTPPDDGSVGRLRGIGLAGAVFLLLGLLALVIRRRRTLPLRQMVKERPEAHQTVAYHIGCLRHEFLKHRIGAAGEALDAMAAGRASEEQRRFLEERLCKGEPLLTAWRAHVAAIDRSLGLARSLADSDPLFRGAERALVALGRVVTKTTSSRGLAQARVCLQQFDRELGEMAGRLSSCVLDKAFFEDVLVSTRSEWASGKVDLDEIVVGPVPDGVAVDVYRTDLRIVLKNLFRNAIAALANSAHPRRLAVDVLVDLEATGEEVVRIRVRDSGSSAPSTLAAGVVDVEHGLGIVRTALLRYDGSLEVHPGEGGYSKAVVVRLFGSQSSPLGDAA